MFIAQKLRHQNITAYVLYMFQVEDTIRAYQLDADRIVADYLPRFGLDAQQTQQACEWYQGLIRMMHEEGTTQQGHVQVVKNTITFMAERHEELLRDPKQTQYTAAYYKALPTIVELRVHGAGKDKSEIENCLDALYGATLLKMQGRELTVQTQAALQPVTNLLQLLAQQYESDSE